MAKNETLKIDYNETLSKEQPDYFYEGVVPADNDEMDYVKLPLKGVRLG
jgi:hypothetical protein